MAGIEEVADIRKSWTDRQHRDTDHGCTRTGPKRKIYRRRGLPDQTVPLKQCSTSQQSVAKVTENKQVNILLDFQIQTDKLVMVNQFDIVVDKQQRTAVVVDGEKPRTEGRAANDVG